MGTLLLFQVSNQRKSILFIKVPKTSGRIPKLIISHESTHTTTTFYIKTKNKELSKQLSISLAYHSKHFRLPEALDRTMASSWGKCFTAMEPRPNMPSCRKHMVDLDACMWAKEQIQQWLILSQTTSIILKLCFTMQLQTVHGIFSSTSVKDSKDSGI